MAVALIGVSRVASPVPFGARVTSASSSTLALGAGVEGHVAGIAVAYGDYAFRRLGLRQGVIASNRRPRPLVQPRMNGPQYKLARREQGNLQSRLREAASDSPLGHADV